MSEVKYKKLDLETLKQLVEDKYDLIKALYEYNPEGQYDFIHNVFCPFHHNDDTPAAKIYEGRHGKPDSLYCFAERRTYTVSDVISKLMGYNIYEIGYLLWNDMTDFERQEFLDNVGKVNYADVFSVDKEIDKTELNNKIIMYKENNITITDLLEAYIKTKGV